jgi:hypothetical protein
MTPVILTRRELYDLVWSKPLRDVAADLGISDVGIAKVCERHRVPRPEQGYWNKMHAGKPAKRSIFVDVNDVHLNRVEINGALTQLPETVRVQIENSRAKRKAAAASVGARLQAPPATDPPKELHEAIELTARTLRSTKPDAHGTVKAPGKGVCHVEVSASSVERIVAFLESKSLSIVTTESGIGVPRDKEILSFWIKEKTRQQKHEPTAVELEAEAQRERKLQKYWAGQNRHSYTSSLFGRAYPEFDTVQTGALVFEIEGYDRGMRRSWADGKIQTIETLLESIAAGIDAILTFRRVEREQREERDRQWNELCQRRDLVKKRRERERQRLGYWRAIARTQREIEMIRAWIERASLQANPVATSNVHRMMGWIRTRLAALEDSISIANVDQTLSSQNLFPETDSLIDPSG